MKNVTTLPIDRSARPTADRQALDGARDLGWDARLVREDHDERPRIESLDRIPFTRDAADHWLR